MAKTAGVILAAKVAALITHTSSFPDAKNNTSVAMKNQLLFAAKICMGVRYCKTIGGIIASC